MGAAARYFEMGAMTFMIRSILLRLFVLLLPGCADYTWTFNERVVYEPDKLLSDIKVSDPALKLCLQQTIEDQQLRHSDELKTFSCTNAGVKTVQGLEHFARLERIDLDDNAITDVTPLTLLPDLEVLHLRNNSLQSVAPLICAIKLREVALSGNNRLDCNDIRYLQDCPITVLDRPSHCREP